jgi:hypothetical protein
MQPLKGLVWGCALAALAALANPAHAGWNNVFQVCCNSCGGHSAPAVSGYGADPCCTPPPTCTTRYIQRTYYQPVVSYQTSTYYQPVTTYKTSYYYEPVCSYRYSCYYDPCTCSYQQVAVPTTSYRLRSQCCPVTSYLQRCCMKPVTTYRAMCYYEPVTTCCQPQPACCPTAAAAPAGPGGNAVPAPAPGTEERTGAGDRFLPAPPPGTKESSDAPPMNPASPSRRRTTTEKAPSPKYSGPHFASLERDSHTVAGRLVDGDRKALSSAKVLFVNVDRKSNQHTATTDAAGKFKANLGEGAWLVYTYDNGGKPVFARRVEVPAGRTVQLTLVNR